MQCQDLSKEKIHSGWWLGFLFLGIGILLLLPPRITGLTPQSGTPKFIVMGENCLGCVLALCVFSQLGHGFLLDGEGLHCYWYGIPYRHVQWETVKQIGVVPTGGKQHSGYGKYILITVADCPRFVPKYETIGGYLRRNYFKVICVMNAKKNRPKFEKFYGPLDYDLTNGTK